MYSQIQPTLDQKYSKKFLPAMNMLQHFIHWASAYNNYVKDIYTVWGIISNLDMIAVYKKICIHEVKYCILLYKDLSMLGFWNLQEVPGPVFVGAQEAGTVREYCLRE